MRTLIRASFVSAFAFMALTASAQPIQTRRSPVEIGIGVSGVRVFDVDFFEPEAFGPAADVRVTIPFSSRFAFESNAMITRETNPYEQRTRTLYMLLVKQRLSRASTERTELFLTYGGTGSIRHVSSDLFAGEAYTEVEAPYAATVGIGFQRRLTRRLALRADAQLLTILYLPLGVRVGGGVSIPLGSYP